MDALFEAAFNRRHRILWFRLTPYCADHLMALDAINSPYSKDNSRADAQDLIEAIRVCSRKELHQAIGFSFDGWIAIQLLRSKWLLTRCAFKFAEYLADYNAYPEFWEQSNMDGANISKTISGYPILARVLSVIKNSKGGIGEARAWQMPVGLLVWYDEQYGELEGSGKRFWSDSEEANIELALQRAEQEAAKLREANV